MESRSGLKNLLTAFGIVTTMYAISQAVDRKKTVKQAARQFAITQKRLDSIEQGIRSLHERIG